MGNACHDPKTGRFCSGKGRGKTHYPKSRLQMEDQIRFFGGYKAYGDAVEMSDSKLKAFYKKTVLSKRPR